jgi:hypothetical protein
MRKQRKIEPWPDGVIVTELQTARDAIQSVIDIFSTLPGRPTSVRRRPQKNYSQAGHAKRLIAKGQNRQ